MYLLTIRPGVVLETPGRLYRLYRETWPGTSQRNPPVGMIRGETHELFRREAAETTAAP